MRIKNKKLSHKDHLKNKVLGKRVGSHRLSITDSDADFFEDIPLYRDRHMKPVRKLGKKHLSHSRRDQST